MRGQERIAEARRGGYRPALIWVEADGYNPGFTRLAQLGFPRQDTLEIEPGENLQRLDLRCVVGCIVDVTGKDQARVAAIARACTEHGAAHVFCGVYAPADGRGNCARLAFANGIKEVEQWPQ